MLVCDPRLRHAGLNILRSALASGCGFIVVKDRWQDRSALLPASIGPATPLNDPARSAPIDFQQLFKLSHAPMAVLDGSFHLVLANASYLDLLQITSEALARRSVFELFPEKPERQAQVREAFAKALEGQATVVREMLYRVADPASSSVEPVDMWWNLECIPLGDDPEHGRVFMICLEDVTDQMKLRRKSDLIAAELRHRIGNLMTMVQVLARKTAQSSDTLDSFLTAFEDRVSSLGATHSFLSGPNWQGMSLRQILTQQLRECVAAQRNQIDISGPEWQLSVIHAQTFAMGIHELLTNSLKFGALATEHGQIQISWSRPPEGGYSFIWKESGLTGLRQPETMGFGMQMLSVLLPAQLEGTAVKTFTPTGFHYGLLVPGASDPPVRPRH